KYTADSYEIDFDDLEQKLADPQTSLMIFCNPHNPIGIIWDRETIARIGSLCAKYHVTVISDEIHCDIVRPGMGYVPFPSASDECADICIQCIAPTKAFNIAGLNTAAVCIRNPFLRHKVWRALNTDEVAEPNAFAITAAVAAFEEGGEWLDGLCEYVFENKRLAEEFVSGGIPGIKAVRGDATYLIWLDVSDICEDGNLLNLFLQEHTGLMLSDGSIYGKGGRQFLRLNVACPRERLTDGLTRLKNGATGFVRDRA
ncbi:MAG: aminotransferase class I/II-fold pyridoxal phosphate-dependent enzyme, partial [Lachnospiraceae bacterium]|nr:aminotransferase class I/II-fold pyridoxal phosphate-dependent enzyme [Lachnospiraceae bacterium]